MNGGPSGFNNAPVTRAFVVACGLFTVFFGIQGRSSKLRLAYQDVLGKLHIWKFFVSVFAFSSTAQLLFGLYLLYYFRVFERQLGSNKYSVFILFSVVVSFLFEALALVLLKDPTLNILPFGPLSLIFSSFIPFYFNIPVSTRFRVFGINFSDKSFVYIAGLQLLFSAGRRSILPGICGILAGSLYHMNIFRIRNLKFPEFISSLFSRFFMPSIRGPPAPQRRHTFGNLPSHNRRQVEGNYPSSIASVIEPPEDSIAMLVSMGFDRNSARQALVRAGNDVNAATNILLESQSH